MGHRYNEPLYTEHSGVIPLSFSFKLKQNLWNRTSIMWQFTQSFVPVLYTIFIFRITEKKRQNNWAEIIKVEYGLKVGETFNLHKSLQKLLVALIFT